MVACVNAWWHVLMHGVHVLMHGVHVLMHGVHGSMYSIALGIAP